MSLWLPNDAGVPQGTKLGLTLFIAMINDLKTISQRFNNWKYVDDITLSVPIQETSILQNELDLFGVWAKTNKMILNPQKCKEMIISCRRNIEHPPSFFNSSRYQS